jgi:hypothetical protein
MEDFVLDQQIGPVRIDGLTHRRGTLKLPACSGIIGEINPIADERRKTLPDLAGSTARAASVGS